LKSDAGPVLSCPDCIENIRGCGCREVISLRGDWRTRGDACRIPFEDEFDVIEHIADDRMALSQMFRATRRGGGVLLTVPQHPFLWSAADAYARHKRRYVSRELVAKVEAAGFEIARVTGFVSLLLPVMALIRRRKKKPMDKDDHFAQLRIGGFLNASLMKISSFERFLIERGVSLPLGGSLLVVATRP